MTGVLGSAWFVPVTFGLFVMLRVALLVAVPIEQTSDFLWYFERAREIAVGDGYAIDGQLTAFWPVGWPGTLALLFRLFGDTPLVGQIANLILSALAFLLTLALADRLFTDWRVGRVAVLLLAVYPNQIAYVPLLSTEIFYQVLLLAGLFLLCQERLVFTLLGGLVFGLATLTKAQTVPLPALLLLGAWWCGGRKLPVGRHLAVTYLAMAVVVAPWTVRNYTVFHAFVPVSTNGGFTLLAGNNPTARGGYTDTDPLMQDLPHDPTQEVATDRLAKDRAVNWITAHPLAVLELVPRKVLRLWGMEGEGEWLYEAGYAGYDAHAALFRAVRIANQVYYFALLALAALSLRGAARSPWLLSGWIVAGYFTVVTAVFLGQSRFHFALMPLLLLYAGWSCARMMGSSVKQ